MKITICFLCVVLSIITCKTEVQAQLMQTVRGIVVDQVLQRPLEGATVTIGSLNLITTADSAGIFRFSNIPIGTYFIKASFVGYKENVVSNIIVNSGKEQVVTIGLENEETPDSSVVVRSRIKTNKPNNVMSVVSARVFSVEETQKFAAAVNDPLRMVTSFPGVVAPDDGNNNIVIRGNSPTGLLWRLEGVDIPNPNHFAAQGSSGGGISILSSQLLANSDFITGAFAAEYGNALSGVFDLKLRKGNNEHREYTVETGLLGINIAAEGPLAGKQMSKPSYLLNYRYSTLGILNSLKLIKQDASLTNFSDFSYHIDLPAKKWGNFSFFGFTGNSSQRFNSLKDSLRWETEADRYTGRFVSRTTLAAMTHSFLSGKNTSIKTSIAYSYQKAGDESVYINNMYKDIPSRQDFFITTKLSLSSVLNYKIGGHFLVRSGVILSNTGFNYFNAFRERPDSLMKTVTDAKGMTETAQAYAQIKYKLFSKLTLQAGLHYLHLFYNNTASIEPRTSILWEISNRQHLSFAFGLHSQMQGLGVYFARIPNTNSQFSFPNRDLRFTKSRQFVASYHCALRKGTKLTGELYYQSLYKVPVGNSDTSTLSTLNSDGGYITDALVNKGKGRNYGLEISIEKSLSRQWYFILSNSFYQSKYQALDGIERNTRYNGKYSVVLTAGKELAGKNHKTTWGFNMRSLYNGGFMTTPIDLIKSEQRGYTVYLENEAYSLRLPAYFRTDFRMSIKRNKKHVTQTLSLDIQNLAGRLNVLDRWYDPLRKKITTAYQSGMIPVLNYRVEF